MVIRPATPADVPAVLPMIAAMYRMHEELDAPRFSALPDLGERYDRWLTLRTGDGRSVFLVAQPLAAAPIAGFLVGTVEQSIPIYTLKEFGFIHDVWVEPAHRGKGLAAGLVDEAIRRFAALGVAQVRLETAVANEEARALFASRGFRAATIDMLRTLP